METEKRDTKMKYYFGCSFRFPVSSAPYNMVLNLLHLERPGLPFLSFINFFSDCITSACTLHKILEAGKYKE